MPALNTTGETAGTVCTMKSMKPFGHELKAEWDMKNGNE